MTTSKPTANDSNQASPGEKQQAQELLNAAGTPAAEAKSAVSPEIQSSTPQPDEFARYFGFESYLSMFETSQPLGDREGRQWLATNVGPEQWIVWNVQELVVMKTCESLEAAKVFVQAQAATASPEAPPPVR